MGSFSNVTHTSSGYLPSSWNTTSLRPLQVKCFSEQGLQKGQSRGLLERTPHKGEGLER
jgi:hypothetical protein